MPQFGSPITKAEADDFFARYIAIKQSATPLIEEALQNPEDLRYYCGRPGMDPVCEDWAYVFSRNVLEGLLQNMDDEGADCVFIFNGAKAAPEPQEGGGPAEEETPTEYNGRPTLMMFPAKYVEATEPTDVQFQIFGRLGYQHPGTGSGELSSPVTLPDSFTKAQYHD